MNRSLVKTTFSDNQEQFIFQFVRDFYSAELQAAAPAGYLCGIEIPDELKDELFMIVGERRFH
jgi:hypothetical protein